MYLNVSGSYVNLGGLKSVNHKSRLVKMGANTVIKDFLRKDPRRAWLTDGGLDKLAMRAAAQSSLFT